MSSSLGIQGTSGRCYNFWADFAECAVGSAEPGKQCRELRDDYFECLHHTKRVQHSKALVAEMHRQASGARNSHHH